jgi:fucose 4-O-acetylase-like acetyltransferase
MNHSGGTRRRLRLHSFLLPWAVLVTVLWQAMQSRHLTSNPGALIGIALAASCFALTRIASRRVCSPKRSASVLAFLLLGWLAMALLPVLLGAESYPMSLGLAMASAGPCWFIVDGVVWIEEVD